MAETIIVVGHKNPDNDAICAAVGYAYLKNQLARKAAGAGEPEAVYKPVRLGPLPPETAWVLQSQGVEEPELIERVEPGQKVVLVDHNELLQAVDGIEEADIVEVVDHHRIGGLSTANPIQFINLPIGSSSTVASLLYRYGGYELPANIAAVMLSSLMTDTVLLKSPTTTQIDRDQAEWLAGIAGVEALEFGRQVIKSRGSGADLPVEKLVAADAKEFQVGDDVVFIAQRETVDSAAVMEREDEMRAYMKQVVADNGYRSFLLLVTDIIEEGSRFICEGDCSLIDKAFGIEVDVPGGVWMPGVLSRKKQAAPPILALA
ncbi:MAG TPA: manganese-dependent inorganic pyrophosphatase [Candidatus Aphodovivens avistercoris]|nr:manganese-dependent inorganic pyrophosphatase [Candidatus Aphodovivens avistercoris]